MEADGGGGGGRHGDCDGAQMVSVSQEHTESQSIDVAKSSPKIAVVVVQEGRSYMVLKGS